MSSSLNCAPTILGNNFLSFSKEQDHRLQARNDLPVAILALTVVQKVPNSQLGVHLWATGSIPATYRKLSMGSTLLQSLSLMETWQMHSYSFPNVPQNVENQ